MANTAFVDDDEIARSVRTIERQRNVRRVVALGGFVLALLGFVGAIALSYSGADDTVEAR